MGEQGGTLSISTETGLAPLASEQAVVQRIKEGDRQAAAALYRWYGDRLYRQVILPRLPNREAAEDVLKDTFRLCLERIETYKIGDRSIFFWLRRIAINRAIDVHRATQRHRRIEEQTTEHDAVSRTMGQAPMSPERAPEIKETQEMVNTSLTRLNPRYATALRLRLLEDRDRDECAEIMGVTVGNFDVILHRACKAFRDKYPP